LLKKPSYDIERSLTVGLLVTRDEWTVFF